ncbi:hypothetical protein [Virgibacillus sp. YIM 98842]|jgi:hypothetical protein|uniref:hypothetical protein n=1 Tax=Virgibacillus sp. YIM 98842 TaxID=2663533 RepID=UPI0013DB98E9|nr:hypothetical protein [Virgibacillus sp. YIM 98842]
MAFGIKREELKAWKQDVRDGKIAILTHYWIDDRFPDCDSVTKVGCSNMEKLITWGKKYGLKQKWIHKDQKYPHFDLFGEWQKEVLSKEGKWDQIEKFRI